MHITTEYQNIGQENFYAAIGSNLLRREILQKVNAQGLKPGDGLGNEFFGYGTVEKPVRVAVIGTGDQGSILIGAMNPKYVQVVAIADIRPFNHHRAFHGDAANANTLALRPGLISVFGWKDEAEARENVKVFGAYQELFDYYADKEGEEDIEAIIIGLPLHLHAPVAIQAMKQGYHVLTEKLMAHTVAQCKEMARASELYQKHCATGHQRHYNVLYDHIIKMIQSGLLGDIHYIRAQWHRGNRPGPTDSWRPPIPREIRPEPNDDRDSWSGEFDSERQQGRLGWMFTDRGRRLERMAPNDPGRPLLEKQVAQLRAQIADRVLVNGGEFNGFTFKSAEEYGYVTETEMVIDEALPYFRPAAAELIRWRLFDRTSAGLMAELGSHQLDAASIFLSAMLGGKQYPLSVSASATRTIFPENLEESPVDRDVEDHIHCVYDYPARGYDPNDELGKLRTITLAYSSINGNGFGGYGETVFGTRGTLQVDTEREAMLYQRADVHRKTRVSGSAQAPVLTLDDAGDPLSAAIGLQATIANDLGRGYFEQIEHWAYCIRENPNAEFDKEMPRCYPEVALADAVVTLATNIAARLGEPVEFDSAWFDIKSDATPEAKYAETDEERRHFTPNLQRYV
ncbi:MAG: Gfo/Idh/MocA family oxidoreductase [Planctomycetaceae bacterium]|nr:Gfo/Idh/MocA family oxidoreductase [Planctomycetaceae bacterium]